jgi:hypothetical protein
MSELLVNESFDDLLQALAEVRPRNTNTNTNDNDLTTSFNYNGYPVFFVAGGMEGIHWVDCLD